MSPPSRRGERLSGLHPIREALAARRRKLHRLWVRDSARHPAIAEFSERARELGIEVTRLDGAAGDRLAAPGVALEAGALPETGLEELLAVLPESPARVLVALDGVEDPQNLGAIARVAEAAGVGGLLLTRRHAPPLSAAVSRASAGAIEWLPVARVPNLARALATLREQGFWVLAAEAGVADSLYDLPDGLAREASVLVLGAEGKGLRPGTRRQVDRSLSIPLGGRVESLNVSTAAAVALFELARRRGATG